MTKYLVPIDGSEVSWKALDFAMEMGKKFEAELYVLHVLPPVSVVSQGETFNTYAKEIMEIEKERVTKLLGEAKKRMEDYPYQNSTHYEVGNVAVEIQKLADELAVDFIIMGNRGLGAFSRTLLGSISNKVINRSHRSVIVIKDE